MKQLLKIGTLSLLMAALAFGSCKKDDDDSPKDILVNVGAWKQTKSETKEAGSATWEVDDIDACDADDVLTFKSDGKVSFDEGATKCDPTDPQTSEGTFSISDDGKTLTLTDPSVGAVPFVVAELTSSKMVLTYNFVLFETRQTYEPK